MSDAGPRPGSQRLTLSYEEMRQLRPTVDIPALETFLGALPTLGEQDRRLILAGFASEPLITNAAGAESDSDAGFDEFSVVRVVRPQDPALALLFERIDPTLPTASFDCIPGYVDQHE